MIDCNRSKLPSCSLASNRQTVRTKLILSDLRKASTSRWFMPSLNGWMKMLKNHGFEVKLGVSHFAKLEQVSLSHLSESTQVPAEALLSPANQALSSIPAGVLSPGPVAVHVDGIRSFTPTDLGRRKGLTPQKFNRLLVEHGLQEKRDGQWCPTEAGKAFAVLLQVHKKQQAGTDVLQLKWKENVLVLLDGQG